MNDFVRIVVDHIARQMDDPEFRELCMYMGAEVLAPFTNDRGLRTESTSTRRRWICGG